MCLVKCGRVHACGVLTIDLGKACATAGFDALTAVVALLETLLAFSLQPD